MPAPLGLCADDVRDLGDRGVELPVVVGRGVDAIRRVSDSQVTMTHLMSPLKIPGSLPNSSTTANAGI